MIKLKNTMKKLVLLFGLAIASISLSAQAEAPAAAEEKKNPNAPVISFDTTVVDYGTINKGDDPLRIVTFTNTGKSPLVITNCQGSCGCTVPKCPKDPIMPGEKGTLEIRYDTKRVGNFNKTVTIKSNASNDTVYLKVKGVVKDVVTPHPFPANGEDGPVQK